MEERNHRDRPASKRSNPIVVWVLVILMLTAAVGQVIYFGFFWKVPNKTTSTAHVKAPAPRKLETPDTNLKSTAKPKAPSKGSYGYWRYIAPLAITGGVVTILLTPSLRTWAGKLLNFSGSKSGPAGTRLGERSEHRQEPIVKPPEVKKTPDSPQGNAEGLTAIFGEWPKLLSCCGALAIYACVFSRKSSCPVSQGQPVWIFHNKRYCWMKFVRTTKSGKFLCKGFENSGMFDLTFETTKDEPDPVGQIREIDQVDCFWEGRAVYLNNKRYTFLSGPSPRVAHKYRYVELKPGGTWFNKSNTQRFEILPSGNLRLKVKGQRLSGEGYPLLSDL